MNWSQWSSDDELLRLSRCATLCGQFQLDALTLCKFSERRSRARRRVTGSSIVFPSLYGCGRWLDAVGQWMTWESVNEVIVTLRSVTVAHASTACVVVLVSVWQCMLFMILFLLLLMLPSDKINGSWWLQPTDCLPLKNFTALHTMHWCRLSACLSIRQTRELWQSKRNFCQNSYTIRKVIIPVLRQEKMIGGGQPLYLKFWANLTPFLQKCDFQSIFACSTSAVTPSEKSSIITNRKSTMHLPMGLRWSAYVVPKPPAGVLKNAKWPFSV